MSRGSQAQTALVARSVRKRAPSPVVLASLKVSKVYVIQVGVGSFHGSEREIPAPMFSSWSTG